MQCILPFEQSQRWFSRRSLFLPSQEPIVTSEFGVEPIEQRDAKAFVVEHHYSGSFPYSVQSFGLFRKTDAFEQSRMVGVATFATPSNPNSVMRWCGLPNPQGTELGRFVLLDECKGNAETWFLARALRGFKSSHPQVKCVLSYSDPHPRRTATGEVVFPGHRGGIYSASNAFFCGRASPKTLYLNHEGRVIANRILSKLRNGEQGRRYAERFIEEFTGLTRDEAEPAGAFVERALATLRTERHRGNYVYVFPLASDRREKNAIIRQPVRTRVDRWILRRQKRPWSATRTPDLRRVGGDLPIGTIRLRTAFAVTCCSRPFSIPRGTISSSRLKSIPASRRSPSRRAGPGWRCAHARTFR